MRQLDTRQEEKAKESTRKGEGGGEGKENGGQLPWGKEEYQADMGVELGWEQGKGGGIDTNADPLRKSTRELGNREGWVRWEGSLCSQDHAQALGGASCSGV